VSVNFNFLKKRVRTKGLKQTRDDRRKGDLTDEQWQKLKPLLPLQKPPPGSQLVTIA
jgi:hypothetical protein